MELMTNDQYDSALQAIINYAQDVRDVDKIIRFVSDMQTDRRSSQESEKASDTNHSPLT